MKQTCQKYIEGSQKIAAGWFSEHVAEAVAHNGNSQVTVIDWKRPDTWEYGVRYILSRNYIIVTGDLGDAVYGFGAPVTFESFLSFDWHYFWEKCCASETGRAYTQKVEGIGKHAPNIRCIAHHLGLQMALKQLMKTEPSTT